MTEHFTWGIVLDKKAVGEADSEYSIFTWDVGKIMARATSSRKTLSRLAGHLEPGVLAMVRIVRKNEKGRFRMAEALSENKTKNPVVIKVFSLANSLIPLEQPDINIFAFLKNLVLNETQSEALAYTSLLKLVGFDPKTAKCGVCGSEAIASFVIKDIIFLCAICQNKNLTERQNR